MTSEKNNVDESKLADLQKELSGATACADVAAKLSVYEVDWQREVSRIRCPPFSTSPASRGYRRPPIQDSRRTLAQLRVSLYHECILKCVKVEAADRGLLKRRLSK